MIAMKNYLTAFFVTLVCSCFVWVLLFYAALGSPVSRSQWIHEAYRMKEEAASEVSGPKVVLVAGSGILFGVDSERLSAFLNTPVVNYGVHAGLGLAYILERSKRVLKPGDIAILPLEYELFQEENDYPETLLIHMASKDPDYFYALPLVEKVRVMGKMPLKRLRKGLKSALQKQSQEEGEGNAADGNADAYTIENINAYGDQVNLDPKEMSDRDRRKIGRLEAVKLDDSAISDYSRDILSDYIDWVKVNDVCLIVMPSNHVYFDKYHGPEYSAYLRNIRDYFNELGVSYIGDPYDYMYEKSYYFGERYHLNSYGIEKRTTQVMADVGSDLAALCEPHRPAEHDHIKKQINRALPVIVGSG